MAEKITIPSRIISRANNKNAIKYSMKSIPVNQHLSQKSKFFTEGSSRMHIKSKCVISKKITINGQQFKRSANNNIGDKCVEIKTKMPKIVKPLLWNYEARFNFLLERHKHMQFSSNKNKENFREMASKYENVVTENSTLKSYLVNVETKINLMEKQYKDLQSKTSDQCEYINDLKADNLQYENKVKLLDTELSTLQVKYNSMQEVQTTERKAYDELNLKYLQVVNKNEILQTGLSKSAISLDALNEKYLADLYTTDEIRRKLHSELQDMKGTIRVFCRVRPPLVTEENRALCSLIYTDNNTLEIKKGKESTSYLRGKQLDLKSEFSFDYVFPPHMGQEKVFSEISQLVQSALDGYNISVFAYGQTGSGKTFTMQGENNRENMGMIPRTVNYIFKNISKLEKIGWKYILQASFVEIYNENIHDLLNPHSKHNHEIRHSEGKKTSVTNLTIETVNTAQDLRLLMALAQRNRAVSSTYFNERSSRSHSVTKITLEGRNKIRKLACSGSLSLVDLAGSESARTTTTERLSETKNINKSLSALGNVMLSLYNKENHVPYRNSKLTYLLQSSLGGNSKTLMFVNISPFEDCYGETINSLRFASKVKEVKVTVKKNKTTIN